METIKAWVKPYTRKARAMFIGAAISLALLVLQDDRLLGWIGELPNPVNSLVLMFIPVLAGWLVREQGAYGMDDLAEVDYTDPV